jgi:hypothetical protein
VRSKHAAFLSAAVLIAIGGEGTSSTGVTAEGPPESNQPETAKGLDPNKDKKSPH